MEYLQKFLKKNKFIVKCNLGNGKCAYSDGLILGKFFFLGNKNVAEKRYVYLWGKCNFLPLGGRK
jgi:hypothetical protein